MSSRGSKRDKHILGSDGKSAADGGEAEQSGAGQSPGAPSQAGGQEAGVQVKTTQEEESRSGRVRVYQCYF